MSAGDGARRVSETGQGGDAARPNEMRILIWMCVLVGINQLGFGAMVPSLPLYAQSFGVAASAIGLAVGIYGLARFLVALPAGGLSDWLGRRPTLALGGLISGLGNLWCAWATGYPEFIVARFVAGAGAGLIVTTGHVVLADISTPERRGRMLSIYMGTFIFAVGIGPFPGGLLAEHYGLSAPFVAYGSASLLAMLVAWFAVAETRGLSPGSHPAGGPRVRFTDQMRVLCANAGYLLAGMIGFINAVVRTGGLFAIVPILASTTLGLSVSQIGLALMIGSISGLVSSYPAGWVADRVGRKAVIVPATIIGGLSMTLFCLAPDFTWFIAAAMLWGISTSVGGSAPAAYAADTAPPGMNAAAMSTFRMLGDAGYVVGPLLLGLIVDIAGPITSLMIASTAMVLVGLAFALFATETHRGNRNRGNKPS
jgi:DHA1 family multidrug resistance protein-like MFS transporter